MSEAKNSSSNSSQGEAQSPKKFANPLKGLFTGRFLVSPQLAKNWPFIVYISFLALIMIASSHSADRKVQEISQLRTEMKELNSEYIDTRSRLMVESMEYKVIEKGEALGLVKSETPPVVIKTEEEK